jgi:ABC-2 type transport system permease protein
MTRLWTVVRKFAGDSWLVFVSQIFELRHMWVWSVVMISLFPLSLMGFLFLFGEPMPERILYIVTGSITSAVTLQGGLVLGQSIGGMKAYRVFDYYASLPISKLSFIFGLNLNALLLCVPSSLILVTISVLGFGLQIVNPLLFLATFALGGFSLAGVGAVIGFYSRSGQIASILTQIANPILVFFAPVYMPADVLPSFLRHTSWFLPTTHVAQLLRAAFGYPTEQIWQPIVILVGFIFITVLLVQRGLDWRGDRPLA